MEIEDVDREARLRERVDQILEIMRKILGKPDFAPTADVMDHGGTSLAIVRILTETSGTLGLEIDPRDLNGSVTALNLAEVATVGDTETSTR